MVAVKKTATAEEKEASLSAFKRNSAKNCRKVEAETLKKVSATKTKKVVAAPKIVTNFSGIDSEALKAEITILNESIADRNDVINVIRAEYAAVTGKYDDASVELLCIKVRLEGRDLEIASLFDSRSKLYRSNAITLVVLIPLLIAFFR